MFEAGLNLPKTPVVEVVTTNNRGRTVEEVAERCLDQIIQVSETAPPVIRDQAIEFRNRIKPLLIFYMKEVVNSDRTTVYNIIRDAGHPDVAEFIRRL
tara:strand:- start:755 stop:1048 length:294 start_codon:yes stop_codon:yes gene_type:complete